jgi:hypothetical protein
VSNGGHGWSEPCAAGRQRRSKEEGDHEYD